MAIYKGEDINLKPTEKMRNNAEKGLVWRKEFGRGGTEVGVARARDISGGKELSPKTVRRMVSFFARHEVDKQANGFNSGEEGFPSAGRIAWELWGGDAGQSWAKRKDAALDKIDDKKGMSNMELRHKTFNLEIKSVEEDDRFFTFEGLAATYDLDRGGDKIVKGAFAETIKELKDRAVPIPETDMKKLMPALWQHNWDEPIGSFVEMYEDEKGLRVKGILPREDSFVSGRVIPQMKSGSISDMSIGYIPETSNYDGDIRMLEKIMLYETSLVTIPMNPKAKVTNCKSVVSFQDLPIASRQREWDSDAAINRVRGFTDSVDEPSSEYKRAFLWFDDDEKDTFGAYKLPIVDVIDGRLYAVPRAIFAAAAALRGSRGGVDIPSEARQGVINNVNRYYDKMGLESPFRETSSFRIDEVDSCTERELESLLKEGVCFSNKTAKTILSALKDISQRDAQVKSQRDAEIKASLETLLKTFK